MNPGNEIDHLAAECQRKGQAEALWLMLRNAYFRDGTPEDGWDAMVNRFAGMGIRAVSDWQRINGQEVEYVLLTRMRKPEQAPPAT